MEKPGVGVAIIVRKDNKVLFGKRLKKFGKNTWHPPGGHIEIFESIEDTAIREAKEETNIDIENVKIIGVTNDIDQGIGIHYVTIWIVSDYASGEIKNMEPTKAEDWNWFEWDKLPRPLFIPVENFIKLGINPFKNSPR
ncbi:NUDIX domain-containing protein [Candidatus Parcubacteria bacterium]|nr:NUDIX domain-containing protein [Candidatus Parcubacteria bacterium]MBT7228064.1 NUDIX domain-containing protein [Candidatus Parcubacteria bacterium]